MSEYKRKEESNVYYTVVWCWLPKFIALAFFFLCFHICINIGDNIEKYCFDNDDDDDDAYKTFSSRNDQTSLSINPHVAIIIATS